MTTDPKKSRRFDDDEWDILSSVGYTASVVAAWRALHAASPHPLVRDDYAKHFITASTDPYLTGLLATPPTSADAATFPRLYGVQTRFFDEFFGSAVADGIRQAVILAAGLDSRAYRLKWPSNAVVFEVDRPKVLEFEARVLAEQRVQPAAQREEVAVDLREDWSSALITAGFDPQQPTAWSVEGLLPYLTSAAQDKLFERIDHLSAAKSRIAIGALGAQFDSEQFALLQIAHPDLNISANADFSGLTYYEENRSAPAEWLAQHGWSVGRVRTNPELQAEYGRTPTDLDAKVDSVLHSQYTTATR